MIIESDDPSGKEALQPQLAASPILRPGALLHVLDEMPLQMCDSFIRMLRTQITSKHLRVLVLDSYSQMRPDHGGRMDIVKVEREEISALDALAKQTRCLILLIHHDSHGHASLDWSDRAGGSYSVGASAEGLIHIARFPNLPDTAPERLIRARIRGGAGFTGLLRFSETTLDYALAFQGAAAPFYEELLHLKQTFGLEKFKATELQETGLSSAGAFRLVNRLFHAKAVEPIKRGEYRLAPAIAKGIEASMPVALMDEVIEVDPGADAGGFDFEAAKAGGPARKAGARAS
jgi:hypothetical protein